MSTHAYILFSKSRDRFYIGSTEDNLIERLRKHNSHHKGFTGSVADWQIVLMRHFDDSIHARAMERKIKAWKSRKRIIQLILEDGGKFPPDSAGSDHPDMA